MKKVNVNPAAEQIAQNASEMHIKDFFMNFEVVSVNGSHHIYMNEKAVLLTFTSVTEHKAQIQMMSIHNKQLTRFVERFKTRVEDNLLVEKENKASDTGSIADTLTVTLGNSNLMLSNLHQMQH